MSDWNHILRHYADIIIGDLEWAERPGRTFEVHLDVHPDHQRKGIGRSMMDELESIAKTKEGMSLYSFSAGDNEKALAFFKGCGFKVIPVRGFYGEGRPAYMYVKTIGAPK